jgi:FAD synthase
LRKQPNGIYLVEIEVVGVGKYLGIGSIGVNPHYENSQTHRLIEVYVYHKFSQPFYGSTVKVQLLTLTRF